VDVDNIIVLCFRLEAVLALIATETTKDEASLFFTTHFDEPAGGFRHDPDDEEQKD
jgi:hypothetical protein